MAIRPPKVLPINVLSITPAANWVHDDGTDDPHVGKPYRWEVVCNVTAQPHSYHAGREPFNYTGRDVVVGDWIATSVGGVAVKIIQITAQTDTELTCLVEDVDRFNTFLDHQMQGIGIGQTGNGFVFELADDGLPILGPIKPGVLPFEFQVDLISRFRYRNLYQNNYRVEQPAHTFQRGDLIYLGSDGLYHKAKADVAVSARVIGMVQDSHQFDDPDRNWFSYQPIGRVLRNLSPALPGGPGSVIYLSDNVAEQYSVNPAAVAKPVFIQLENATTAILLERGFDGGESEAANMYMVADMDEMLALDVAEGSQVYVRDSGNGEWAIFLRTNDSSSGYRLMINQDASDSDAETFAVVVTHTSDAVVPITTVSPGSRVLLVTVRVTVPFSTAATLTVGDPDNHSRLLTNEQVDLSEAGVYQVSPPYQYPEDADSETPINVYLDASSSPAGEAEVVISYT